MLVFAKIIFIIASFFIILFALINLKNREREYLRFLSSSLFMSFFLISITLLNLHNFLRVNFNISSAITYIIYFIIVMYYFFIYRKMILQNKYILVIISLMFFGLANAIDLLDDGKLIVLAKSEIVEDIFHILGTAFWLFFFIDYSIKLKKKM